MGSAGRVNVMTIWWWVELWEVQTLVIQADCLQLAWMACLVCTYMYIYGWTIQLSQSCAYNSRLRCSQHQGIPLQFQRNQCMAYLIPGFQWIILCVLDGEAFWCSSNSSDVTKPCLNVRYSRFCEVVTTFDFSYWLSFYDVRWRNQQTQYQAEIVVQLDGTLILLF